MTEVIKEKKIKEIAFFEIEDKFFEKRMLNLCKKNSIKINQIKSLIEDNSNDMELGKKIRTMYWDDRQNDNQLGLFNE